MPYSGPLTPSTPYDYQYQHIDGEPHTLIKLKADTNFVSDFPTYFPWLFAVVSETDIRVIPYRYDDTVTRGWNFVKSHSDLTISELKLKGYKKGFPVPTNWVAVYGLKDELSPLYYAFNTIGQDFSMLEQEDLRRQLALELPNINNISRLYEDEMDLTPSELAAAPVDHITVDRLRDSLNKGTHFVSLSGHGNTDGCCGFSNDLAKNLANRYHTFIGYADSCLTNAFDVNDAVSEISVCNPNGGAVAYVGNTRFGLIGIGNNFQRAFFHRLSFTKHLGLLNDVRCSLIRDPSGFGNNKWTIFVQNLIGDPEMPVWLGSQRYLNVSFTRKLDSRKPFTVKLNPLDSSGDYKFSSAVIHVQQENFSRFSPVNQDGVATFDISTAKIGNLDVTITLDGEIPFLDSAYISGPYWVSGTITSVLYQSEKPDQGQVTMQLDESIGGESIRSWYLQRDTNNHTAILNAIIEAQAFEKTISLYVNSLEEGSNIEGFRIT